MSNKENNFKEKFKQAIISTARVISDDYKLDNKPHDKSSDPKKKDFFDLTNLSNKHDFVRLRAEADSNALKKKFSNQKIFNKNLPNNPSCKSLYNIAEKIRYELLGSRMLKGVGKNLSENYNQKISANHKEQLKSKEDVTITEAFELYMLKNFFNLQLDTVSLKTLSFWEKDFHLSIEKHIDFLSKNLENQNNYSLKFSEIFKNMDIFDKNNEENKKESEEENKQENKSENNNDDQTDKQEESQQDEAQTSLDAGFDISDQQMDEQSEDSDALKESMESMTQKINNNNITNLKIII